MRKMMMLIAVMLVMGSAVAQEAITIEKPVEKTAVKLTGKELRKQKRAERKVLFEVRKKEGEVLIEERDFVLRADRLGGKNSIPVQVSNQINFIKIDGDELVVQFGNLFFGVGNNGLGGATFKGRIKKIESTDLGKGKAYLTSIQFSTPFLDSVTTINLSIRGNEARAAVWNNGRVLNFEGLYSSIENSGVHQSEIIDFF